MVVMVVLTPNHDTGLAPVWHRFGAGLAPVWHPVLLPAIPQPRRPRRRILVRPHPRILRRRSLGQPASPQRVKCPVRRSSARTANLLGT